MFRFLHFYRAVAHFGADDELCAVFVAAGCTSEDARHWGVSRRPILVCSMLLCPRLGRATDCTSGDRDTQEKPNRVDDAAVVGIEADVVPVGMPIWEPPPRDLCCSVSISVQ